MLHLLKSCFRAIFVQTTNTKLKSSVKGSVLSLDVGLELKVDYGFITVQIMFFRNVINI